MTEFWTTGVALPRLAARFATTAEEEGWDGMVYPDSQNLAADVYVGLAMAVGATERLQLGTGVTNPFTRHPAVTASAIATLQAESDGRMVLGIGRGDSSLAHLGYGPASPKAFRRYLEQLQAYLRGEDVPFDEAASVDTLALAATPESSRLHWLRPQQPKVPVDVAATGPKVIAIAAAHAERISFAVGADVARMKWAIETANAAAGQNKPSLGAYLPVVSHPDRDTARLLAAGGLASFARFSVMHGTPTGPVDEGERAVLEEIARTYDMAGHFRSGSPQSKALTDEFFETFGIVGPAGYCVERLRELIALGLERIIVMGAAPGADRAEAARAHEILVNEAVPELR